MIKFFRVADDGPLSFDLAYLFGGKRCFAAFKKTGPTKVDSLDLYRKASASPVLIETDQYGVPLESSVPAPERPENGRPRSYVTFGTPKPTAPLAEPPRPPIQEQEKRGEIDEGTKAAPAKEDALIINHSEVDELGR